MKEYARDAVDFSQQEYRIKLDFSEKSIRRVDTIVIDLHRQLPKTKTGKLSERGQLRHTIDAVCKMYGAYLGEVIRANLGGRWRLEPLASGESIITLKVKSIRLFPQSGVYKRLTSGEAGGLWYYYKAFKQALKE
jgi:hypothetical protein